MFESYAVFVAASVEAKLKDKDPPVTVLEIEEAFFSLEGGLIIDTRKTNRTVPPTVWFISETAEGRILKVVGIFHRDLKAFAVKTAYDPDQEEINLYEEDIYRR